MGLRERILNKEINVFPIGNEGYRFYGKTSEVKEDLKQIGAFWNKETESYEISLDNYSKISADLREFMFKTILNRKMKSLKLVSDLILNDKLKIYPQNEIYKVYGKTKEIRKDLYNIGFRFENKNFQIDSNSFEDVFSDEVKEKVNSQIQKAEQSNFEEMEET